MLSDKISKKISKKQKQNVKPSKLFKLITCDIRSKIPYMKKVMKLNSQQI
jgi:hypothetical protein